MSSPPPPAKKQVSSDSIFMYIRLLMMAFCFLATEQSISSPASPSSIVKMFTSFQPTAEKEDVPPVSHHLHLVPVPYHADHFRRKEHTRCSRSAVQTEIIGYKGENGWPPVVQRIETYLATLNHHRS